MLEPSPTGVPALAEEVATLRAQAAALAVPPPVLDGWASLAALDYELLALRIAGDLHRVRAALESALLALTGP